MSTFSGMLSCYHFLFTQVVPDFFFLLLSFLLLGIRPLMTFFRKFQFLFLY